MFINQIRGEDSLRDDENYLPATSFAADRLRPFLTVSYLALRLTEVMQKPRGTSHELSAS